MRGPTGIALDTAGTRLFITDYTDERVRMVVLSTGIISTIAGGATTTIGTGDGGSVAAARFVGLWGIDANGDSAGSVFVVDGAGNR